MFLKITPSQAWEPADPPWSSKLSLSSEGESGGVSDGGRERERDGEHESFGVKSNNPAVLLKHWCVMGFVKH